MEIARALEQHGTVTASIKGGASSLAAGLFGVRVHVMACLLKKCKQVVAAVETGDVCSHYDPHLQFQPLV